MDLLTLKKSKIHRHGVFTKVAIKKGQVVERSPYILVDGTPTGEIGNYIFDFNKNKSLVALMFGSLFNHADKPNIDHEIDIDNKVMEYTALENIPANQECFINYGEDYWKKTKTKKK